MSNLFDFTEIRKIAFSVRTLPYNGVYLLEIDNYFKLATKRDLFLNQILYYFDNKRRIRLQLQRSLSWLSQTEATGNSFGTKSLSLSFELHLFIDESRYLKSLYS